MAFRGINPTNALNRVKWNYEKNKTVNRLYYIGQLDNERPMDNYNQWAAMEG